MEEEKAAAYYDELSRKGSGAARFKQGLGFSSSSSGAALAPSSSSSFLGQFVKASNPSSEKADNDRERQKSQIESIQNKLRKRDSSSIEHRFKDRERGKDYRDRERRSRRSRTPERRRGRRSRSRSHSSEDRERRRSDRGKRNRRSRSRSFSDDERKRGRERRRRRSRSRSSSPGDRDRHRGRRSAKENNVAIDYAKLIKGYDEMTPAERVKAKMKLQLSETAAKDTKIGTGSGWERFDFDKDAPLDNEDEEIEGANDDAKLVKHLGQTFRFSTVQARREDEIKAAHDEAMFGAPVRSPSGSSERVDESENEKVQIESNAPAVTSDLFSDKLIAKKAGSWRDRAPRNI